MGFISTITGHTWCCPKTARTISGWEGVHEDGWENPWSSKDGDQGLTYGLYHVIDIPYTLVFSYRWCMLVPSEDFELGSMLYFSMLLTSRPVSSTGNSEKSIYWTMNYGTRVISVEISGFYFHFVFKKFKKGFKSSEQNFFAPVDSESLEEG